MISMAKKNIHKNARVLVVDDELSMRELLEIVLQNAGYDVSIAESPDKAIKLLESESFDAVLTDLLMENDRMAGMHLLKWIQENEPTIPTVIMTAHGSVETAIEAMQMQINTTPIFSATSFAVPMARLRSNRLTVKFS